MVGEEQIVQEMYIGHWQSYLLGHYNINGTSCYGSGSETKRQFGCILIIDCKYLLQKEGKSKYRFEELFFKKIFIDIKKLYRMILLHVIMIIFFSSETEIFVL